MTDATSTPAPAGVANPTDATVTEATEAAAAEKAVAETAEAESGVTYLSQVGTWTPRISLALVAIVAGMGVIGWFLPAQSLLLTWLALSALLALFILVSGFGLLGLWRGAFINERDMIDLSRMQLILWTVIILGGFLTAAIYNVRSGAADPLAIAIPEQIWVVLGISTTNLVATPLLLAPKKDKPRDPADEAAAQETVRKLTLQHSDSAASGASAAEVLAVTPTSEVRGHLIAHRSAAQASWADMFRGECINGGAHLDMSKVQLFFFTVVLVLAYAVALGGVFQGAEGPIAAFPDVSTSLVALLGISHGGHLVSQANAS